MDINLISIISSTTIILIFIAVISKFFLDNLKQLDVSNKKVEDMFQKMLLENQENLLLSIEKNTNDIMKKFEIELNTHLEQINNNYNEVKSLINNSNTSIKSYGLELKNEFKEQSKNIIDQNEFIKKSTNDFIIEIKDNLIKELSSFSIENSENIKKYSQNQDKNSINLQTALNSNFLNMIKLVNNLRLDNLINVSNEISKYKEGIYEDDHFLQVVGHCKIIKITDKKSGEITDVYYDENGEKSFTETFDKDLLKYTMKYENGKLRNGIEFNQNGEISFEYIYDDAEEISKKIEYIYDESTQLKEKKEINY